MVVKANIIPEGNPTNAPTVDVEFSSQRTAELAFAMHQGRMSERQYCKEMDKYREKMLSN